MSARQTARSVASSDTVRVRRVVPSVSYTHLDVYKRQTLPRAVLERETPADMIVNNFAELTDLGALLA